MVPDGKTARRNSDSGLIRHLDTSGHTSGSDMTLKIDAPTLAKMEQQFSRYRRIKKFYEEMALPQCHRCSSEDTAIVGTGLVGRSIYVAAATNKLKLIPNDLRQGKYFCHSCEGYFD